MCECISNHKHNNNDDENNNDSSNNDKNCNDDDDGVKGQEGEDKERFRLYTKSRK